MVCNPMLMHLLSPFCLLLHASHCQLGIPSPHVGQRAHDHVFCSLLSVLLIALAISPGDLRSRSHLLACRGLRAAVVRHIPHHKLQGPFIDWAPLF